MNVYEKTLSTGKLELKNPITVGDNKLSELDFPLANLRGRDIVEAQTEFEVLTGTASEGILESNKNFLAYMASKIAKVPYDSILDLAVRDFNAVTLVMQRFLYKGE